MATDVVVETHGISLVAFRLKSPKAEQWVDENVEVPDHMWLHPSGFACETSFADAVAGGMESAGLELAYDEEACT